MNEIRLTAPCHFGLESVLKREIYDLGYEIENVDNGKVTFVGDVEAIALSNIHLRTTERILINVAEFYAKTFTELFDAVAELEWERYIPKNGKFFVSKATSINSALFSTTDIQSIVKKAIVTRLSKVYGISWFEESGATYPIRISILKDKVLVGLDTSGVSLHKRGYRKLTGKAPISETLAASIIMLTPWKKDRILVDPFCGTGTFLIEAALIGLNIPPGINRDFISTSWENLIPKNMWEDVKEEARANINMDEPLFLAGYDNDEEALRLARVVAKEANVFDKIHLQKRDVKDLSHSKKYGFIITNPPYGERLSDAKELEEIYKDFGTAFNKLADWSAYVITPYENIEKDFNKKANKKRKLYNGMIKTNLYSFLGTKPKERECKR